MRMNHSNQTHRSGFTLLELIVSTAMLAMLATACMMLVRTSYTAWNRHEDDHSQRQEGLAVLRHIARQTRQSKAVMAITAASDNSGSLSLLTTDGRLLIWNHNAATKEVLYGENTATNVLATGIEELTFIGLKVNGSTQTTSPGLIHSVECTTKVNLIRPAGIETVTSSCRAWLRAW